MWRSPGDIQWASAPEAKILITSAWRPKAATVRYVLHAMRTLALAILIFLSLPAYGSRPIMEDESLACVSGGTPGKAGEIHTVSFNDGDELNVLGRGTIASAAVLKSSEQHSAAFKIDGSTTQTISFNFEDFPDRDVCFRYDASQRVWSVSGAPRNVCQSCSLKADGT